MENSWPPHRGEIVELNSFKNIGLTGTSWKFCSQLPSGLRPFCCGHLFMMHFLWSSPLQHTSILVQVILLAPLGGDVILIVQKGKLKFRDIKCITQHLNKEVTSEARMRTQVVEFHVSSTCFLQFSVQGSREGRRLHILAQGKGIQRRGSFIVFPFVTSLHDQFTLLYNANLYHSC